MRRFLPVAIAGLASSIIGVAATLSVPALAGGQDAPLRATLSDSGDESSCLTEVDKTASPTVLLLGEKTTLTLHVSAVCAGKASPLNIAFVLDASGSMQGTLSRRMKDAAVLLVQKLDLTENPATMVGVVQFNDRAKRLSRMTNSEGQAVSAIKQVESAGGTSIDLGIQEGMKVLIDGRYKGSASGNQPREVLVVLSDGDNNGGCSPVLLAANKAKGMGMLVTTVCVGPDCDIACMKKAATRPRYAYTAQGADDLARVFEDIRREVLQVALQRIELADSLPDNMRYVAGSALPMPDSVSGDGSTLEWETNAVPLAGITYTLQVEPQQEGFWPTNVVANGTFRDSRSRGGAFVFPVPWVTVLRPVNMPSPTALSVTPTPTTPPPPTVTPAPRPTSTPMVAWPTVPIYIPIAVAHPCVRGPEHSDVALVLDLSTSMSWPTRTGRRKLDASLEAATIFVRQMDLGLDDSGGGDQVAVIGFNRRAWIEQDLTGDRVLVEAGIERLARGQAEYTRLDLALERGQEALEVDAARPDVNRVIVLLTDGLPNQVPYDPDDGTMETTIMKLAQSAWATGAVIYTIGIGSEDHINADLLGQIAGDDGFFVYEPDVEDLGRAYDRIVGEIDCPATRFGWSRSWPDAE